MNAITPTYPVASGDHGTLRERGLFPSGIAAVLMLCSLVPAPLAGDDADSEGAGDSSKALNPSRIIQYRGLIPHLRRELWSTDVELRFELYRSPTGGAPFWTEVRTTPVRNDGWVHIDLGEVDPLPDEAFTTPFRFLSIWHGEVEFRPRKQIASLTYVASPQEKNLPLDKYQDYVASALMSAKAAAAKAPGREDRLDAMVDCGAFRMEQHPRMPATWLQAVASADKLNARLPTFEEWYGAYDGEPSKDLVAMIGHYEWVIPWVYEPSIHARFHELYRGKPAACFYNELSPLNDYPFRLVLASEAPADSSANGNPPASE